MMKKLLSAMLMLAAFTVTQAKAAPFGFAADGGGLFITQGYQGFNYGGAWGAESWVNETASAISNYYGVGPTALGAAWSNGGSALTLTSSTSGQEFNFGSVSLNAGFTESVTIEGWLNGSLVNSWTGLINNQYAYTDVVLNWIGIDEVHFSGGANLFVTNIDTAIGGQDVPEPASIALIAAGLLGLGALRRKNAQTSAE